MAVFCNPVTKTLDACLRRHDEIFRTLVRFRGNRVVVKAAGNTILVSCSLYKADGRGVDVVFCKNDFPGSKYFQANIPQSPSLILDQQA